MKSEREETNMYLLMNKDKEIMQFNTLAGPLGNSYEIISQNEDQLPYGFTNIAEWISTRKGSKHNAHLKQIMKDCGCEDDLGYIRVTHAASLNDTYWIKMNWNLLRGMMFLSIGTNLMNRFPSLHLKVSAYMG